MFVKPFDKIVRQALFVLFKDIFLHHLPNILTLSSLKQFTKYASSVAILKAPCLLKSDIYDIILNGNTNI